MEDRFIVIIERSGEESLGKFERAIANHGGRNRERSL